MPGSGGPKGVPAVAAGAMVSKMKYKKEPGIDEDEDIPDKSCDDRKVNTKNVSDKETSSSSSHSLSIKSRDKRNSCLGEVSTVILFDSGWHNVSLKDIKTLKGLRFKIFFQSQERESTLCLGGELASYDEVKVGPQHTITICSL